MDLLRKYFPYSFRANDVGSLIVTILVYIIADVICGFVIGLLAKIPLLGVIFSLIGSLVGLYAFAGIVLSILVFVKVIK